MLQIKKPRAYVNGVEVVIREFQDDQARCYIPSMDICNWYKLSLIEVRSE